MKGEIFLRTLRVEFTEHEIVFLDGNMAGIKGEHLATQLIITLPDEMTSSMLDYYIVSFRNYQAQKIYCSQAISEGGFDENYYLSSNKIYIKVPAEATASSGCFVVVEGYKAIDDVIVTIIKSPCFKLEFKDSIGDGARDNLKNLPSPLTIAQKGITVTSANITEDHHLMIGLSDHSSLDAGVVSHTDNNYTDEDKFIVDSLETGAQVNRIEKISLNGETISISDKNVDINLVKTDNNYTNQEKSKLSSIEDNAQVNRIEKISLNGENISISNKNVDINLVKTDNNYTNQEKSKLSSIEDNAQVNRIETLTVNGITVPISNKHADITITAEEMPMADYIVERGTTNGWEWEKWASGKAVATGRFQKLGGVSGSTGVTGLWVRYADFYFPTGLFVSAPFCFSNHAVCSDGVGTEWCTCTSDRTNYTKVRRYSSYGGKDLQIDVVIKAEGTWK